MTINLSAPKTTELKPRIVVIGVGGAGGNAVNNMISSGLEGVDFIVANTDAQALLQSKAERQIQLGANITQGLGCGARPDIGRASAEEAIEQIVDHMTGTHMAFITAGMGGGTGTGAAPVIAEALRDRGILTVGVVTKPFQFEGSHRMAIAEQGIEELQTYVDTLIIIPNQNLFRIANEKTTFADAFSMADDVLHSGVRGITDLMVMPGLINLDFADVKTVMSEMGKAMMGTGEAEGERRATEAAEAAISNPLLDDVSMKGARGVLINISGGMDLTLYEVDEAANRVREEVDPDANIIVGSALDDALNGRMRVSVVATGIEAEADSARPRVSAPRLAAVAGRPIAETQPEQVKEAAPAVIAAEAAPAPMQWAEPAVEQTLPMMDDLAFAEAARVKPAAAPAMDDGAAEQPAEAETGSDDVDPLAAELDALARAERVPPPKPLQPSPEPLFNKVTRPEAAEPVAAEQPFIAPRADAPRFGRASLTRPDAMAEAAAVNAGRKPEAKKSRAFQLFRRMTGGSDAVEQEPVAEAARPAPAAAPAAPARRTESAVNAPGPQDRLSPPREDEDLLEIPSFLRRQAN